ncbi:WbqC family protein [Prevotella amnii]|uniref:WbqC family protein n=1 Tax=Prevotella amnii TaxID=419005 RepID=UPI0003701488|nr:WbqC family protein [Prevotella amnii]
MKLGIMQPYFMPYIGYWQLIKAVDKYVIFDDVNYIKKGWINRNNILVNGNKKLFTISLHNASQNKLIKEISIADDFKRLDKTIIMAYSKAPYFIPVNELLHEIYAYPKDNLALFVANSIKRVVEYLEIKTELILSSKLKKDIFLKGQDKILAICRELKADTYINAIGGKELYEKQKFKEKGLNLFFLEPIITEYKQLNCEFVRGLSMIDIMMFNSPEQIREMLSSFELL